MTSYGNNISRQNSGLLMKENQHDMFHGDYDLNANDGKSNEEISDRIVTEAILKAGHSDTEEEITDAEGDRSLSEPPPCTDHIHNHPIAIKVDSLVFMRRKNSLERIAVEEISSTSLLDENEMGHMLESEYSVRRVRSESNIFHESIRRSQEERFFDSADKTGFADKNERRTDAAEIGPPKSFLPNVSHGLPRDSGDQKSAAFDAVLIPRTYQYNRTSESNESIKSQCSCDRITSSTVIASVNLMEKLDKQVVHLSDCLSSLLPICGKYAKSIIGISAKQHQKDTIEVVGDHDADIEIDVEDDVDDESCSREFQAENEDPAAAPNCASLKDLEVALKNARNLAGDVSESWRQHRQLLIGIIIILIYQSPTPMAQ